MSYDLFFLHGPRTTASGLEQFQQYLLGRPRYSVQGGQIWYQNEATGVYFSFELGGSSQADLEAGEEADPALADGLATTGLAFNINYFRPHIFGLEAELELSALVAHFALLVDDPQQEGMGRGEYSAEGFLRGWNAGNLFAHRAFLGQEAQGERPVSPPQVDRLPAAELERLWTWNYNRDKLQAQLGEETYVSQVRLIRLGGKPVSFLVWGDAIPEALPAVDYVLLLRDELAPKSLFRGRKKDTCLVPFAALSQVLKHAEVRERPIRHYLFRHAAPPRALQDFFRSQKPFAQQLDGLAWDAVRTAEVVQQAEMQLPKRGG